MKIETYSSIITLDQTNFETHLRAAFNSKLPRSGSEHFPPSTGGSSESRRGSMSSRTGQKASRGGDAWKRKSTGALVSATSPKKKAAPSLHWELHIRNTYFPTHIFHLSVAKKQFKLITKHYGPQFNQKKLLSIVRQALDPDFARASFGYFFTEGHVDVHLGDNIVEKLRGKSRRRPLSTSDILILKIMFQGQGAPEDPAEHAPEHSSPTNQPDLVFWLVMHQKPATAPFDNYRLIRSLERDLNLSRIQNNELRAYMTEMHREMNAMRLDMKLIKETLAASTPHSFHPLPFSSHAAHSSWFPWKNPRYAHSPHKATQNTLSTAPHSQTLCRTTLSHVVLTALNQFESSVLAVSDTMNGQIPYSQKVSLVISLARGLLNCDVDFDLVVQFKESLLEHIESSETIETAKSIVLSHLMDLLNPVKAVNMSTSFNSSIGGPDPDHFIDTQNAQLSAINGQMPHMERIYRPPVYDDDDHKHISKRPLILMLIGMHNVGKTTVALQLATYYASQGTKCAILETDATSLAFLKIQAEDDTIPFYGSDTNLSTSEVTRDGMRCLLDGNYGVIIIDTPGFDNPHNVFSSAASIMHTVANVSKEMHLEEERLAQQTEENTDTEEASHKKENGIKPEPELSGSPEKDATDTSHIEPKELEISNQEEALSVSSSDSSAEGATKPTNLLPDGIHSVDEVFVVLDASIGNEAGLQVSSFKNALAVRSCIVTKIHHPFAIGALSAIASTGTGISFISTSDKNEDVERYDVNHTLTELLDMQQKSSLSETEQGSGSHLNANAPNQNTFNKRLSPSTESNVFTLRDMQRQFDNVSEIQGESCTPRIKKFQKILQSMTQEELDHNQIQDVPPSEELERIAKRTEETSAEDVKLLYEQYLSFVAELGR